MKYPFLINFSKTYNSGSFLKVLINDINSFILIGLVEISKSVKINSLLRYETIEILV